MEKTCSFTTLILTPRFGYFALKHISLKTIALTDVISITRWVIYVAMYSCALDVLIWNTPSVTRATCMLQKSGTCECNLFGACHRINRAISADISLLLNWCFIVIRVIILGIHMMTYLPLLIPSGLTMDTAAGLWNPMFCRYIYDILCLRHLKIL